MLYQLYETQRSLAEPVTDLARVVSKLYAQGAVFGQLPLAQRLAAGYDLLYRLGKGYEKPEFGIQSVMVANANVVIQEAVEIEKPFCQLRRFKRFTDDPDTLRMLKD
ncbi:polyhydroxyalkanoate depolymerase, partial [Cupriavidus basilensis]|nr:polyhydroxyalkanoate depolymerase [Cupriavidus basilensis]